MSIKKTQFTIHYPHVMRYKYILPLLALLLFAGCRQAAEHSLRTAVDQYNQSCPVRMSELTRIDSLCYDKVANEVAFYCTMVGITSRSLDDDLMMAAIRVHGAEESRMSLNKLCVDDNGKETLMLLEQLGAKLVFVYQLEDGAEVFRKSYSKEDWK